MFFTATSCEQNTTDTHMQVVETGKKNAAVSKGKGRNAEEEDNKTEHNLYS